MIGRSSSGEKLCKWFQKRIIHADECSFCTSEKDVSDGLDAPRKNETEKVKSTENVWNYLESINANVMIV